MTQTIIGWDIGGAHLKATAINQAGAILAIIQHPCPLWKGIDQLHIAVNAVMQQMPVNTSSHALTMTGELVDCFSGRDDGVRTILAAMQTLLPEAELLIYAGSANLIKIEQVQPKHYQAIASANWLASASFAAQKLKNGLFVDIGSTTTDILLLNEGEVLVQGYSDYERLISKELVYTGIVRTPVMAVAQTAQDESQEIGIMAEYFATMADVYRVTGELNEAHDQTESADGAEKTLSASARRLARMIGSDFCEQELPRWRRFAQNIRSQHKQKIRHACESQLERAELPKDSPLIGAGVGRFLVQDIAQSLARPYVDFSDLFSRPAAQSALTAADCAPAIAVAYLVPRFKPWAISKIRTQDACHP